MMGTYGVADVWFLLVALGYVHSVFGMCHLSLLIGHLAYVMQQSRAFGLLGVESQFRCHNGAQVGGFTGMLEQVLAV